MPPKQDDRAIKRSDNGNRSLVGLMLMGAAVVLPIIGSNAPALLAGTDPVPPSAVLIGGFVFMASIALSLVGFIAGVRLVWTGRP